MGQMYGPPRHTKLFIPTLIGAASLAGLFPLSGFFGKAAIEASASSTVLYLLLLAIGFASSTYVFRWLFVPMQKRPDKKAEGAMKKYKGLPTSMMAPIYVLAALAAITGYLIYYNIPCT